MFQIIFFFMCAYHADLTRKLFEFSILISQPWIWFLVALVLGDDGMDAADKER